MGWKKDKDKDEAAPFEGVEASEIKGADITIEAVSATEGPTSAAAEPSEGSHGSDDEGEPAVRLRHPLGSPTIELDPVKDKIAIDNKKAKGWYEVGAKG